jgi:hypothetical protein
LLKPEEGRDDEGHEVKLSLFKHPSLSLLKHKTTYSGYHLAFLPHIYTHIQTYTLKRKDDAEAKRSHLPSPPRPLLQRSSMRGEERQELELEAKQQQSTVHLRVQEKRESKEQQQRFPQAERQRESSESIPAQPGHHTC